MSEFHGGQSNSPNITIVNYREETNDEQTLGEAEQIPKVQVLQVFPVPWDMGEVLGSKLPLNDAEFCWFRASSVPGWTMPEA